MRVVPEDEYPEFIRRLREQARRDAEELVPRPGYPVYGLAEPSLTPVLVAETMRSNGEWTLISLTYGRPEDVPAGPYVTVTTIAVPEDAEEPGSTGMPTGRYRQEHGHGPEAELRFAVEREQDRGERWAGGPEGGAAGPDAFSSAPVVVAHETLRDGEAFVVRQGNAWAARLETGEPLVAVTVVGRGVAPESIRVETLQSLRPLIEGRTDDLISRIERNRGRARPPLPVPDLPPAHGAAALRALVDFTLATGAEIRSAAREGRDPRHGREQAGMYNALWQRAVRERQRLAGEDERTANYVVTSAVNHLGHLDSEAAWFAPTNGSARPRSTRRSGTPCSVTGCRASDRSTSGRATGPCAWPALTGTRPLTRTPSRLASRPGSGTTPTCWPPGRRGQRTPELRAQGTRTTLPVLPWDRMRRWAWAASANG
jgi:hypothetical protein